MMTPKSRVLALLSANLDEVVPRVDLMRVMDERPMTLVTQSLRYSRLFNIVHDLISDGHAIEEWPTGVRLLEVAENYVEAEQKA